MGVSQQLDKLLAATEASGGSHFSIVLRQSGETPLGIDVDAADNKLMIEKITEGLIPKWNTENPNRAIQAGDRIAKVNETKGCPLAMVAEIRKKPETLDIM